MNRRLSPGGIAALAAAAVILVFLPKLISLYVDWLWFNDLRFGAVFTKKITTQMLCSSAGFVAGFLILYLNLALALRATKNRIFGTSASWDSIPVQSIVRHLGKIVLLAPVLLGFLTALVFYRNWLTFLYYFNASPFGHADPIFQKDAAFYVFSLPAFEIVAGALLLLLGGSLAGAALLYVLRGGIFVAARRIAAERVPGIHLAVLGGLIFFVLAFESYIGMHEILYSFNGHIAGANYTDVHAVIPFLKIKTVAAVVAGFLLLGNILLRRWLLPAATVALYVLLTFAGGTLYPPLLQKFVVAPNELVKETPYIRYNIAATRKAFGLENVEERDIAGGMTLAAEDIKRNSATIENIRLWDHKPLLDTFSQVQEIRTYYEFVSVDNDRYTMDGLYRQTMLSPRELSSQSIPTRNWINEVLTFTHGYGLTLGPVNQVTPEGLPVLLIKDIPPVSAPEAPAVKRPEIYFGELSSEYVIVNTKAKEFDYPSGEENVYNRYSGSRGVRIDSMLKKTIFAEYFGSMKILLSNDVTADSRVLFRRNIKERVRAVMPFLLFDGDPYMVISDEGRLFWMYDAYTSSSRFPYAQPISGKINYLRNSVKVTIDAYDGSMEFYISDDNDPIIRTVSKTFPGILRPISEMPADLRKHVRYPEDIFRVQTAVYSTYHMQDPQIFYNKEDQWEIPVMGGTGAQEKMEPYYTIMKLPGETGEEFILMLPFNPKKKDNLSAWMAARSDGEDYGKLIVYRFPKDRLVYGPKQIVARINQDTEISRQISLWDQRGSQVIQGTLLVIPIENSLIYVQPLYLRAETGKIPELKRVIVAYENRIAMEQTLDAALAQIFGGKAEGEGVRTVRTPVKPELPAVADLAARAGEHYDRALKAQREGDWAGYGEEIKKLGKVLDLMKK